MIESLLIQALMGYLAKSRPEELAKVKKVLVRLHDYIEIVFPELAEATPPQRLSAARESFEADAAAPDPEVA